MMGTQEGGRAGGGEEEAGGNNNRRVKLVERQKGDFCCKDLDVLNKPHLQRKRSKQERKKERKELRKDQKTQTNLEQENKLTRN